MFIENLYVLPIRFVGLLAQDVTGGPVAPDAGAGGPAQNPGGLGILFENPLLPMGILFFLFYFIVLAPERKRKRREQMRLAQISKNDRVITAGGIHGVVVQASPKSDVITVRIDDKQNVRVRVNRSMILGVNSDSANDASDSDDGD